MVMRYSIESYIYEVPGIKVWQVIDHQAMDPADELVFESESLELAIDFANNEGNDK